MTAHARNGCKVTRSRAHCLSNDDRLPFMPEHSRRFLRSTREHPFWANRFSGLASYSAALVVVITPHCKSFHGTPFLSRGCFGQHQNLCTRFGFRHGIAATVASSEVRSRLSGYCRKNRASHTSFVVAAGRHKNVDADDLSDLVDTVRHSLAHLHEAQQIANGGARAFR